MNTFTYYKSKEIYRDKYYQMPKVFFTNENYIRLSNDAKIAYMLLKDRFEYSVANNWVDEEDNIYFVYTVTELMDLLQCREGKIAKIKKELENVGLLKQKKGRLNKGGGKIKTTPNLLYLGKTEVTATDVFKINQAEQPITTDNSKVNTYDTNDSTVNAKIATTVNVSDTSDSTVNAKIATTVNVNDTNGSTVNAKIADNLLYSKGLDTNRHLIDSENDQRQDQVLLDNFVEMMTDNSVATFIPERVLNLVKVFSPSYSVAQQTVKTIHNAKHKAEKETGVTIVFEELAAYGIDPEQGLYTTLLKAYQKNKTEKVENVQNLLFIYVKNWFIEQPIAAKTHAESKEQVPVVSLHNWLE